MDYTTPSQVYDLEQPRHSRPGSSQPRARISYCCTAGMSKEQAKREQVLLASLYGGTFLHAY